MADNFDYCCDSSARRAEVLDELDYFFPSLLVSFFLIEEACTEEATVPTWGGCCFRAEGKFEILLFCFRAAAAMSLLFTLLLW